MERRLRVGVAEHGLDLLPERCEQVVSLKLCQILIALQPVIRQNAADDLLKRSGFALAENAHERDLNRAAVKSFELQIIELLGPVFVRKEFYVVLDHRLIPLVDAEIKSEQRGTVCEKLLGVSDGVCEVVIPNGRLRKGRIDKIIRGSVYALQKVFRIELVVRRKVQNLGIFQFQRVNILGKLRIVVIPEDQLPHVPGKLRVELICDLF